MRNAEKQIKMNSSVPAEAPAFQEASRCDVCKCSFSTFRRRHHCRCCGRTLCYDHSSHLMALPQFHILTDVRVCADCFNNSQLPNRNSDRLENDGPKASIYGEIRHVADSVSRLDVGANATVKDGPSIDHHQVTQECTCGMPLCICLTVTPTKNPVPEQKMFTPPVTTSLNVKPKKPKGSTSSSNLRSAFDPGVASNSALDKSQMDYEASGEGLRQAIKNNDVFAVKKLLSEGVDAKYCDKQGFSMLHLAALFNQTETSFILMEYGARLDCKNAQGSKILLSRTCEANFNCEFSGSDLTISIIGETPLDCAPVSNFPVQ